MLNILIYLEVGGTWCFEHNIDYPGNDLSKFTSSSAESCQERCQQNGKCVAFTWDPNPSSHSCSLKSKKAFQVIEDKLTAGDKFCGIKKPTDFLYMF